MSAANTPLAKRFIAELLGTFMLVFMGTFAITSGAAGSVSGQRELSIGLAFGVAAIGAIYAFGHVSGAHLNPAVTFSLALRGRFPWKEVVPYAVAQIIGAIIASLVNASIIGETRARLTFLGRTYPNPALSYPGVSTTTAALITEVIVTFILILTILSATEKESPSGFAGLAIGLVFGINVMLATNISGGSLNPARSLGPVVALVLLGVRPLTAFDLHWIYWLAPLLGGFLAVLAHQIRS